MIDYIVVGLGVAGISFCEQLDKNGKTYKVISDDSQVSSLVAGGMYNPVILKRFTMAWNADLQLQPALSFYKNLEQKFNIQLDYKIPVLRKFASIIEQNRWFEASDKPRLKAFLNTKIIDNSTEEIDAPFGWGEVLHTGRIDLHQLIKTYREYLISNERLIKQSFDFDALKVHADYIEYGEIKAHRLLFATGFGMRKNPYFNYLPLNGTKGELLTIKVPGLKLSSIVKSSVFIIPLENDLFRVGATYENFDKTNNPTEKGKDELLQKLNTFLNCEYEIVDHKAGVRPTVRDRRPLAGVHPEQKNLFVLNGFGSRGVLVAPTISEQLYNYIENDKELPKEINIERFHKIFAKNS